MTYKQNGKIDVIGELKNDGYSIIKNIFSEVEAQEIRSEFENDFNSLGYGSHLYTNDLVNKRLALFFMKKDLVSRIRDLVGNEAKYILQYQAMYECHTNKWHRDNQSRGVTCPAFCDINRMFKVAYYGQAHTELYGGTLEIIEKSHKLSFLHRLFNAAGLIKKRVPRWEIAYQKILNKFRRRSILKCCERDIVIFDQRLIHRASQPSVGTDGYKVKEIVPKPKLMFNFEIGANAHAATQYCEHQFLRSRDDSKASLLMKQTAGVLNSSIPLEMRENIALIEDQGVEVISY